MCADAIFRNVTLAFVKRVPLFVAVTVANDRQWNVLPAEIEQDEDIEGIFSPDKFTIVWTKTKSIEHQSIKSRFDCQKTLINCIPGAASLSYDKWRQYSILQEYLKGNNTSLEQLRIMPATYLLKEMDNHIQTLKASKPNSMWIVKPCTGYGGRGVRVFDSTESLNQYLISSNNGRNESNCVVQEYISDLLLLNQRKFDIRVPLLIASTQPLMYYYHDGYLRVALMTYDPKGPLDSHLTAPLHYSFNPDEHFWSFSKFQEYLDLHYPNNGGFVQNILIPKIKNMALLLLKSGLHMIDRSHSSCFQLIGLDVTVSNDGHVWFIESNNNINLQSDGWMMDYNYNMIAHMFDLLFEMRTRQSNFVQMPEGSMFGSWQLIWNEKQSGLIDDYDPCKEFVVNNSLLKK